MSDHVVQLTRDARTLAEGRRARPLVAFGVQLLGAVALGTLPGMALADDAAQRPGQERQERDGKHARRDARFGDHDDSEHAEEPERQRGPGLALGQKGAGGVEDGLRRRRARPRCAA